MIAPAKPTPTPSRAAQKTAPALPELDDLRAFAAFAEHLNFTRAARALGRSQPAVHGQVRRLGETLGAVLYQRRGRALELTADGRRVLRFAREVGDGARELRDELRSGARGEPVVLCAGEGAYLYLLGPAVKLFVAQPAPLRLLTRDADGTLEAVRTGEAHLGVAPLERAPDGLSCALLADVGPVLAMPRGHPLARKRALSVADLEGARLVVPPPGRPARVALASALAAAGVRWHVAVEASGWGLLLHFVSLGVGLAAVNGCCSLPDGLVSRPLRGLPRQRYHLLERAGGAGEGAPSRLRAALLDATRAWRPA